MQPSRNFDDLKFSSIHRRILLWGSGGPFLDGYVLVMIGVALEQLAISPIKSDGAKCSSLISSPSA